MIRCLAIDDEPLALEKLKTYIVFRDLKTTINNEKHIELNHCISTTFIF